MPIARTLSVRFSGIRFLTVLALLGVGCSRSDEDRTAETAAGAPEVAESAAEGAPAYVRTPAPDAVFRPFSVGSRTDGGLEALFNAPPQSAGAYAWWHWCGGNVSEKGITRDLEAMKRAGLGGVTLFNIGAGTTNAVNAAFAYRNDEYWRLFSFAAEEAKRLGLAFGYCNSAGYSCSGGPWVTPEYSMKKLVWTSSPKGVALEQPETNRGFYRDIEMFTVGETSYRFGYTTTGKCVHPAPAEIAETGLEADKFSREAMNLHWDHAIGEVVSHVKPSNPGLSYVLMDSYEAGDHDWTDNFPEEFKRRRGYDPVPLLPYLADAPGFKADVKKDVYLADLASVRRELLQENHYELFRDRAHAAGLEMHLEPYSGPFDSIAASTVPDVAMTEFWAFPVFWAPEETRFGGDVWFCGPASRATGKTIVGAEAFTAMPQDDPWSVAPRHLKRALDATFARGVNRLYLHHWVHQPFDPKWAPGMTMGFWGTHFGECQTWFEPAIGFYRYMGRCQALCQAGEEVVDTLSVDEGFPSGQRGDTVTKRMFLSEDVQVGGDGSIRLSSGRTYRWLRRPWSYKPDAAVAERFAQLVKKGARLWTPAAEADGPFRVLAGDPDGAVIALPRVCGRRRFFFVCNSSPKALDLMCAFRASGTPELWFPYDGRCEAPADSVAASSDRTDVRFALGPLESAFVVFPEPGAAPRTAARATAFADPAEALPLEAETLTFFEDPVADPSCGSWTRFDNPEIKYFSGTASYHFLFLPKTEDVTVDLGDVRDVAEIWHDGEYVATLWYPPFRFRLKMKDFERFHIIEVRVTNTWRNRLIGDARLPDDCTWGPVETMKNVKGEMQNVGVGLAALPDWALGRGGRTSGRRTFSTWNYFTPDSELHPAGLLGPVVYFEKNVR